MWLGVISIGLEWDRPWQLYAMYSLRCPTRNADPARSPDTSSRCVGYVIGALLALGVNLLLFVLLRALYVTITRPTRLWKGPVYLHQEQKRPLVKAD